VEKTTPVGFTAGSELIPQPTGKEKVEPYFRLHPLCNLQSWRDHLEAEFRPELEGARTARTEHAGRASGRPVATIDVTHRRALVRKGDGGRVSQVRDVKQVEDLTDQIETHSLLEPERLSQTEILRDDRVAADLGSRGEQRQTD